MKNNSVSSKRLGLFPEYPYAELARMKKEVEKKDSCKVLDLSIGSPTFPPSKVYIDKLKEYLDTKDAYLYPGNGAIPELREALKKWYKKRFNVSLEDTEIFALLGAKDGVSHIPLALLDSGDEILIPDPGYPAFTGPAVIIGAVPIYYKIPPQGEPLLQHIVEKITKKTKAIWINIPGNPTGYTCTFEELKQLVVLAKKNNILILYDNAYSEITFNGYIAPSILEVPAAKDIAIEVGSFSKAFSFAGFRMGWIVGNKDILSALSKVKSQMDSGLMQPLQLLGAYALNNFNRDWHNQMIAFYQTNRDTLIRAFEQSQHKATCPKGALYLWISIPPSFLNGIEYTKYLLMHHHILVTPGSVFGPSGKKYIRASYSSDLSHIADYFPIKLT